MKLKQTILACMFGPILLAGGCGAPFLHSASSPESNATDPGLVGEWVTSGPTVTRMVITEASGKPYAASLTVHHDGELKSAVNLDLTLTDIGNARYADLFLARGERDKLVVAYGFLVVPVHQIMKLSREGDQLRVWSFDGKWLEQHAADGGFTTDRLVVGGGETAVLTAPAGQVRAFLAKTSDKAQAFREPMEFRRVRP